jgi:hypothetical protein
MSSEHIERSVYVNGQKQTVRLKPRDVSAKRLTREEKAAAREEARLRESIETASPPTKSK